MEALSFQANASEGQFPKGCCKPESGVPAIVRANGVDAAFPIDLKAYVAYAFGIPTFFRTQPLKGGHADESFSPNGISLAVAHLVDLRVLWRRVLR
jgi:hypothetical protein